MSKRQELRSLHQITQYNSIISSIEDKIRSISKRKNNRKKAKSSLSKKNVMESGNFKSKNLREFCFSSNFKNCTSDLKSSWQTRGEIGRSSSMNWGGGSSLKKQNCVFSNFVDEGKIVKELYDKIAPVVLNVVKGLLKNFEEKIFKEVNLKFDMVLNEVMGNINVVRGEAKQLESRIGEKLKNLNFQNIRLEEQIKLIIEDKENIKMIGNATDPNIGNFLKIVEDRNFSKKENSSLNMFNKSLNDLKSDICGSIHNLESRILQKKKLKKTKKKSRRAKSTLRNRRPSCNNDKKGRNAKLKKLRI